MLVISPKRINEAIEFKPFWYNYYASYSHTFTKGIINSCKLNKDAVILDPWNGTGTTTLMSSICGYKSIGIDLNPVMKIISLAKLATYKDINQIEKKLTRIRDIPGFLTNKEDALLVWFTESSVSYIRFIESIILENKLFRTTKNKIDSLNSSQGLMYTALFNCVREYLKPFIPSNPTWIKKPKPYQTKISISWDDFTLRYISLIQEMIDGIGVSEQNWDSDFSNLLIDSSSTIKLPKNSIDLVLTSPPYCTRIDYGIATLPELSIVCVNGLKEIDTIRRSLMGATTVPKEKLPVSLSFGETCINFLNDVERHNSKASISYYHKNFIQYFNYMDKSIKNIARIMKNNSRFICVAQDSYYKNIHCDLPTIISEISENYGLNLVDRIEFESKQSMVHLNMKSKKYRNTKIPFETVMIMNKD